MNEKIVELKEGVKAHLINTNKYKTDITCIILTTELKRDTVTKNALIPFLLKRGTQRFPSQYKINVELDNMYGALFNCGVDKYGDNIVLKFFIETINNNYSFNNENILEKNLEMLLDIVFNPVRENGYLCDSFLNTEKENLKKIIESKIDNKDLYAFDNCISNMYEEKGFGLYKYGYIEDLDSITVQNISEYYNWLIDNSKIDIFVSGEITDENIENYFKNNQNIKMLKPRIGSYILNNEFTESKQIVDNPKEIRESMNISQGKLVIGLDILEKKENYIASALVYNAILGDGANSMLFQNVREKEGLAYSARSSFIKQKSNIFIRCGIEIENYDKAIEKIMFQMDSIKQGKFTDENLENAKIYLISGIKTIEEEQDTEIVYYIGQEISNSHISIEKYIEDIEKVTREDVLAIANAIQLNTIYFLSS